MNKVLKTITRYLSVDKKMKWEKNIFFIEKLRFEYLEKKFLDKRIVWNFLLAILLFSPVSFETVIIMIIFRNKKKLKHVIFVIIWVQN